MGNQKSYRSISIKFSLLPIAYCLLPVIGLAQRDSSKKTTIDINSSYKPVLRNAVKINFSASQAKADTALPKLDYNIPAENLFYSYQPIPLEPKVLVQDSNLYLGIRNYIKAGFGNYTTPYVNAGFSFGNGRKSLYNLYADYISSKGTILHQDYSKLNVKTTGSYFLAKHELYGGASLLINENYLYGYDHELSKYNKGDIRQHFFDVDVYSGLRNTVNDNYGVNYNPSIRLTGFINKDKLSEYSAVITAPVEKHINDQLTFKVEAKADLTYYFAKNTGAGNVSLNNHVVQVAPSFIYSMPWLNISGGIIPTWDNGKFEWLPNVYAQVPVLHNTLIIQGGWVGRFTKNTYRNLSAINPYLQTFTSQTNTKEIEYFGGIKATLAKHFNINAKIGLVQYSNLPFLINDTATDNKSFVISNESRVSNLKMHGDISYINKEKFTATAGITLHGYMFMQSNARAWNTVPAEINASVRWWPVKQVMLKADFYAFGGGHYLQKGNTSATFRPGTDLSAGIEFKITKRLSAWLDVNNILNDKYQRWHNYEVYGLNLLGGLKLSF